MRPALMRPKRGALKGPRPLTFTFAEMALEIEQLISRRELERVTGAAADGTPLLTLPLGRHQLPDRAVAEFPRRER